MNYYGIATGTDAYSLNVSEKGWIRPGDIVTVAFLNANTGAATLDVNGFGPVPLRRNDSAMSAGDLVALTFYQFCFTGASFIQDVQAAAGATTDASLLTSGTLAEARLPNNINATHLADGTISNTEFQYLNNLTGNIQSQLDAIAASVVSEAGTRAAADSGLTSSLSGKADTSHTHSGADITTGTVPVAAIPTAIPATSIANGTVDNTEFQALNGVTSNIQNQLDNKAASSHSHAASDITSGTIATARLGSGTADSTTFLCGDQTYKTVSATDSTKIPLAGSASITGPLGWSANTGNGTSSAMWCGKDANGPIFNVGSGGSGGTFQIWAGNSLNMAFNETYGHLWYVTQTYSSAACQLARTAYGMSLGVTAGLTNQVRVPPTAVATGGSPVVVAPLQSVQTLLFASVAGMGTAILEWDGATLTKLAGVSTIIVGTSAGGTEVAFDVSSSNLRARNGTGASKNISCVACFMQ